MGAIRVCCTHLDHISENERAIQAGGLVRQLHDLRGDAKAMLVVGDLNALSRADYSAAEWAEHVEHNAQRGWAAPSDSAAEGGCLGCLLVKHDRRVELSPKITLPGPRSKQKRQLLKNFKNKKRKTGIFPKS